MYLVKHCANISSLPKPQVSMGLCYNTYLPVSQLHRHLSQAQSAPSRRASTCSMPQAYPGECSRGRLRLLDLSGRCFIFWTTWSLILEEHYTYNSTDQTMPSRSQVLVGPCTWTFRRIRFGTGRRHTPQHQGQELYPL